MSDLWPESAEKMGIVTNKTLLKIAYNLEKKCYKKAKLITGQTQGIVDSISARFPDKNIMWLPNGVDISFYNPDKINQTNFRKLNNYKDDDVIFFYGGILGYAQGLEIIIKTAELLKGRENIKFVIQGSGPEKEKLIKLKDQCQTKNVSFLDPVPKSMMPGILKAIDVAVIPLKKLDLENAFANYIDNPINLNIKNDHFADDMPKGLSKDKLSALYRSMGSTSDEKNVNIGPGEILFSILFKNAKKRETGGDLTIGSEDNVELKGSTGAGGAVIAKGYNRGKWSETKKKGKAIQASLNTYQHTSMIT